MKEPGPFDRILESSATRDRSARTVLIGMGVLGVILLLLVLIPGSPIHGKSNDVLNSAAPSGSSSVAGAKLPKVPDGYEALSKVFTLEKAKNDPPYSLTVNLVQPLTNGQNIGLYTNKSGKWEKVASATLVNNGAAAKGEVQALPANVAVLRRTSTSAQVTGYLPGGAQVDPASLDAISVLSPADYTPSADGTIAGTATTFDAAGKSIVPTIRASQPKDVDAENTVLAAPDLRDAQVAAILTIVNQPGVTGIDIDFEGLPATRKADFSALVASLADKLHAQGKTLSLQLPAPVKTGVAWDTGAYDWEALAKAADSIKLFPERDPSAYYKKTQDIVDFLRPKIDVKKLVLIVSRLSVEKGSDGLSAMSLSQALTTATAVEVRTAAPVAPNSAVSIVGKNIFQDDGATGIQWDPNAFAVSFSYPGRGGQRTVWLENSLSVAFRIDLAKRLGLGGIAIDDVSLSPDAAALWGPVRSFAEGGAVALVQPNGTLLRPTWQGQAGSIDAGQGPQKGNIVWKAPTQAGTYDIALIVSDGVIRASQKVSIEVKPGAASTPVPSPTLRPGVTPSATPKP